MKCCRSIHIRVEFRSACAILASGEERKVEADWLWGCDGARSLTRKTLGIELEDLEFDQPWLVVDTILKRDVELPDLAIQGAIRPGRRRLFRRPGGTGAGSSC